MSKNDECEALIDKETKSYSSDASRQRHSSRLEWAETSWTRWLSILFWTWINPILSIGYKRLLTDDDLDALSHKDKSYVLLNRLNNYDWTKMTTINITFRVFWKQYLFVGFLLLPYTVVRIAQPLFLRQIVLYFDDYQQSSTIAYLYVVAIGVCLFMQTIIQQQYYFYSYRVGLSVRNALTSFIYQQLLSMKISSFQQMNSTQILNLVANDATKFEEFLVYGHSLWNAPLECSIVFGLLCWIIGLWPTVFGFIVLLLLVPLQLLFSKYFSQYRQTTIACTDKRVHVFNQFLNTYQLVKMYNWEEAMKQRMLRMRQHEFDSIKRASCLRAVNIGLIPDLIPVITAVMIVSIWFNGHLLKAVDIFTVIALYSQLRIPIGYCLPVAIEKLSETLVAGKRIDKFLKLIIKEDEEQSSSVFPCEREEQQKGNIIMRNATFSWNNTSPCLSSLNINIESGMLVGIVGAVGSGKSSLLAAILGEMNLINGEIDVKGNRFSYAAQSAWIYADTIRANILLGKPFDQQRYENVLRACCLDVDLQQFGSSGDLTMIGEKGVNLSGGQRARVSLARALYVDADIYLLDDPLAAVDRFVAKQIYDRCLGPRGLLNHKTRLLVTYQTEFLTESHQTIFLVHGHIEAQGLFHDLSLKYQITNEINDQTMKDENLILASMPDTKTIFVDETPYTGTINWSVWSYLFTAPPAGWCGLCLLIVLLVSGQILLDYTNYWVTLWSRRPIVIQQHSSMFSYIYLILIVAILIVNFLRATYCFHIILNGSNNLHKNMITRLLYTSIHFFQSNPSGRILNRACNDQQIIDEIFPFTFFDAIQSILVVAGPMIVISLINPWVLLVFIPILPISWIVCHYYLRSSFQIKRLENAARSPVYALFVSSADGLTTIRAFEVKSTFQESFINRVDAHTRACIARISIGQWFGLRIELLTSLFLFVTSVLVIILGHRMDSSLIALSLMYSITLSGWLQWGLRQIAEAGSLMTSAERIYEYVHLPLEEDHGGDKRLILTSPNWPMYGRIEFRNYSLSYRSDLGPVLRNINLRIESGQKIGIIGRTGAGKSSLFQGLLRLVNRASIEGEILIDDIDISRITLKHLRSHISVIPQHPVLFDETLRYNLDPFDQYTDQQCINALENVQLQNILYNHPAGILQPVVESGNNLSVGQRQLICIARAILKRSQILLIDEATSSIDCETEALIQSIIANKFHDKTILTIAHRHSTIARCDRIILLDNGRIIKFDTPDNVLHLYQ